MIQRICKVCLIVLMIAPGVSFAQKRIDLLQKSEFDNVPMGQPLDSSPWNPDIDPDIDMYLGNYLDSAPRITHGALIERAILTQGNNMKPPSKGALLIHVNRLVHAQLPTAASTEPTTLKKEQELFYVVSGRGVVRAGTQQVELRPNICFLVPENLTFTMTNTGDEPLTMMMVSEPVPDGFTPRKDIAVRDEGTTPIGSSDGLWCMIYKGLFSKSDGFGTIFNVLTVSIDPMTIYWPHSHFPGCEEVWVAIQGTSLAWIGKQVRPQPPGTAYMIPNDRRTVHCNLNASGERVKFFYFSTRKHKEPGTDFYNLNVERSKKESKKDSFYTEDAKTFGETYLDPAPYTPGVDPDINQYLRNWKESMPKHTHGSLVERDILTKGDPMKPTTTGAVLSYVNRFTRASLAPYTSTIPTTLKGEQEILYVLSGKGIITAGGKTADLYKGVAVLVPPNLEFTLRNAADEDLAMYLVSEPVRAGFTPRTDILVRDESGPPAFKKSHWVHEGVSLFGRDNGLSQLSNVLVVSFPPMSIGHPHTYKPGGEEVWTAVEGTSIAFIGKQIRMQPPGTAYMVPPNGKITHSNINQSQDEVKFFYFLRDPDDK